MKILAFAARRRVLIPLLFTLLLAIPAAAAGQVPLDFGDAPDPLADNPGEYPTLLAHDGARHDAGDPVILLGADWDAELDGQPTHDLDHPDADENGDDDDGVTFPAAGLVASATQFVTVTGTAGGLLNAWIDFDQNGSWLDPGEQIATDFPTDGTAQQLSFTVPAGAALGTTYSRFRLDSGGGLSPSGYAADGEVEDYGVRVHSVSVAATLAASPNPVGEPGGPVSFLLLVANTGSSIVNLFALTDDLHGDLTTAADTTCTLPMTILPAQSYACSFTANVTGQAGEAVTDTVTIVAAGSDVEIGAAADVTVEIVRDDPFNLFENGHFDGDPMTLDPWVAVVTPPSSVEPWVDDSDGSPLSSSVRITQMTDPPVLLAQCVPVEGGVTYELAARVRFFPETDTAAALEDGCEHFSAAACSGLSLGSVRFASILPDDAAWASYSNGFVAPAGAVSALCDFAVVAAEPDSSFEVFLDGLFFGATGVFADGFESGDFSAWSEAEP